MGKLIICKILTITIVFLCFTGCNDNIDDAILQNESVIINNKLYQSTVTNNYSITDVKLENNLLSIKISSSGCGIEDWNAVLIDANEILESYPVQRNIKLALENNEACLAVFEKEFTFNISTLKEDFSELYLNLEGWNTQIHYQ
ncbi:hypothetical protein [Polaribacter sp.]|uniref:hypothetical protein n=1 Tax=Polaribacter sp. TaxID=1920175 RepID=UPI003F6C647F